MQQTALTAPVSPVFAMLPSIVGIAPWQDALASLLCTRYGADVQKVATLADGQPERMYDFVLDLSGGRAGIIHAPLRAKRWLVALYGRNGRALDPQLLMGQTPWLAIAEQEQDAASAPRILADSCVALPQWGSLETMRRMCEARLTQLVLRALDHLLLGHPLPACNTPPHTVAVPLWLAKPRFAVVSSLTRAQNLLRKPFAHIGQWRLATRIGGEGSFQPWPVEPNRFLADPFLLKWKGATYLFCEEYSHDTGRGAIVWSRFHPSARGWSVPRPALVRPWHLSYPFVLRGPDGNIYMLPEQGSTGVLTLYQAERFPDRWRPVADLLSGDDITDATLYRDAQGWWLFCGSGWDELFLYHAESLRGPYRPHPQNPVKSDARSARPGGRIYRNSDGALIRPTQDCSRGYGSALSLCRIDELSPRVYRETVIDCLQPGLIPGSYGVHSYDRLGDIEVIDGKTTIQRRHWDMGILVDRLTRRRQQNIQIAR